MLQIFDIQLNELTDMKILIFYNNVTSPNYYNNSKQILLLGDFLIHN